MDRFRLRHGIQWIACLAVAFLASPCLAQTITLAETPADRRPVLTQTEVVTQGKVITARTGGEKDELKLDAGAKFEFLSRRLPPAGRDAMSLREVREFRRALLKTVVAGYETGAELPAGRRRVVTNGQRDGLSSYALDGPLTRETADLLEIPGDPLGLVGTLPAGPVEVGDEWQPADWVLQMLTGIEAVESSQLTCKLEQVTAAAAKITFSGKIVGQKLGTNTTVNLLGVEIFHREQNIISQAKLVYSIGGDVGAVNPGIQSTISISLTRTLQPEPGALTDAVLEEIPLEARPADLLLTFDAAPWDVRLFHNRDWHLFQAVYDGGAPVAIFRLVKQGSLIAQCNVSPAPKAAPGQAVPLEQFESDVQLSLGDRLREVISRDQIPTEDGRSIYRLAVAGTVVLKADNKTAPLEMIWVYYLVTDPQGRRASFVFSIEPDKLEQLGTLDREMVTSLQFGAVQQAAR